MRGDRLTARVRDANADALVQQGRVRAAVGGGALELRDIRLMASGVADERLNGAAVSGPDPDLDGAREFYGARGTGWGLFVPRGTAWTAGRRIAHKRLMGVRAGGFRAEATTPAGLRLRAGGPDDLDAVVAIDVACFGDPGDLARAWLGPHLTGGGVDVAVAELDGAAVGTAYAVRTDGAAGPAVQVGGVAVLPAARRRGIGAALTAWLVERAFAAGAGLAHLSPDDDAAARLYERLGFVEVDGVDVWVAV